MELLTKQEYADYWKVSPGTVDKWMAEGKVKPVYTPGGTPRFRHPEERDGSRLGVATNASDAS